MSSTPPGWQRKRLTDLAFYLNGAAFGPEDWGQEGLPIIRIEQLRDPGAISDYFSGSVPESNKIDTGDLIFSWSASLFLRIWQHGPAVLNQHLFKVVEKPGVDRVFLKYLIEHNLEGIGRASHGSTMTHITRKELDKFAAIVPSNEKVQRKIGNVLSTIDKSIAQTEALITKHQRIKIALMKDLLTRGIDDHGLLRSEDTHAFKDSPLGPIPVEWEVTNMKSLAEKVVDGVHHTPTYVTDGIPFVVVTDLTGSDSVDFHNTRFVSLDDHNAFIRRADPHSGDILVTKDGTLGVARIVPEGAPEFSIFVSVAMIRPKKLECVPELIWSFFDSGEFLNQLAALSAGTGLSHIHLEHFQEFLLRKPGIEEQRRIFDALRKIVTPLKCLYEQAGKLRLQKTALMQDLLTGKVSVTPLLKAEAGAV